MVAEALGDKGKQGGWAQPQVRLPALGRTGEAQGSWGSERGRRLRSGVAEAPGAWFYWLPTG